MSPPGVAGEEVAFDALVVAVDFLRAGDLADQVDGGAVAGRGGLGDIVAADGGEVGELVIEIPRQVRRRVLRFPGGDLRLRIDDEDFLSFLGEQVRRGQTGDPGPDHANVVGDVTP